MNQALEIAGAGMVNQQRALDIIANNVSNLNTPSFRRSGVHFSELIVERPNTDNPPLALSQSPQLAGVVARPVLDLDEIGQLDRSGRSMDLAIDGRGFIELMGPNGQSLLWRGGGLSVQEDGLLATSDGVPLRAGINVPADMTALEIRADGQVLARTAADPELKSIGQITLVRFNPSTPVERLDGGLYLVENPSDLTDIAPNDAAPAQLAQGFVERSNVALNDEMVDLLVVQRAYAANAQVVQVADQLMALANNLRR
jgi:flagellar basal-body rod protein FlgG